MASPGKEPALPIVSAHFRSDTASVPYRTALRPGWCSFVCSQNKKLSYRRVTARCVLSAVILPITTQQCRNYLYDKS